MRLAASAPDATRVQVFGAAGVGEAIAWREMPLVGERLRQVHDLNQDTLAKAEAHAAALLDRTPPRHRLRRAPNPAQLPPKSSTTSSDSPPPERRRRHENARSRPGARLPSHRHRPSYQQKITLTGL